MIQVSVIMPIHNAEAYLQQTLESVTGQSLKNIEIICVDDGSEDRTREILEVWRQKDSRIRVLAQENLYAGVARNNGLKLASGEYVIFWDADDLFHENALELLVRQAEKEHTDICVCAAQQMDARQNQTVASGVYLDTSMLPEKETFNKYDIPEYLFEIFTNVPWNKLYRRAFLLEHHLQYQAIRQSNDTYFTMTALFLAERISVIEDVLISYRVNNSESVTGRASDTALCPCEAYRYTWEAFSRYPDFEMVRNSFLNKAASGLLYALSCQSVYASYEQLYNCLAGEVFPELGIARMTEEQFHVPLLYWDVQNILELPPAEYLLRQNRKRKLQIARLNTEKDSVQALCGRLEAEKNEGLERIDRLKEKVGGFRAEAKEKRVLLRKTSAKLERREAKLERLEEKLARQEEKLALRTSDTERLRAKLQSRGEEVKQLKAQLREQKKQLDWTEKRLNQIRSSRAYRLGSRLLWLPRKIKQFYLRSRKKRGA